MPQGANMVWCFSIGTSYILFNLRQGAPNVSAVLYDGSLKASGGVNEHTPVPQTLLLGVAQDDSYLSRIELILKILLLIFATYRSSSFQEKSIIASLNPDLVCLPTAEFFQPPTSCRNQLFV